jgi:hypothetical protein
MVTWTKIKHAIPTYDEPVLIKTNNTTQFITYVLRECAERGDWFEPYFFEHDDDLRLPWFEVSEWVFIESLDSKLNE